MNVRDLETHVEPLLRAAIVKCGDTDVARDLTQDTLTCALLYISRGGVVENPSAFLNTILNRRWNDYLRGKYRGAVSIEDLGFDIPDVFDPAAEIERREAEAALHGAIARLSAVYREAIVRHYLQGHSVKRIADLFGVPEGTVKRRLHDGREKIKKELSSSQKDPGKKRKMETYDSVSYKPVKLQINCSGNFGNNGEPQSLWYGHDLLTPNLLWLAYNEPASVEDLSPAIGIPCAYIEPTLDMLVEQQLMKKIGNKYATTFIISSPEDNEKYIPAQKTFVADNFDALTVPLLTGLETLRSAPYFVRQSRRARLSFELHYLFRVLDYSSFQAFEKTFSKDNPKVFPDRPNGGRWLAFATVFHNDYDEKAHAALNEAKYSGQRWIERENIQGAKKAQFRTYDAIGFHDQKAYYWNGGGGFWQREERMLKLLTLLNSGEKPHDGNVGALTQIPYLEKLGILRRDGENVAVELPIITFDELKEFDALADNAIETQADVFMSLLEPFMRGKKKEIPPHLTNKPGDVCYVPLQFQYTRTNNAVTMAVIRTAIARGVIHDGRYDDGGVVPYPMILAVEP